MTTYDGKWLADRLDVARGNPPEDYFANCPVHGGSDSLHVGPDRYPDGNVKVICFNDACGATLHEVVAALEDAPPTESAVRIVRVASRRSGRSPLSWWVDYTGVPADVWTRAGVIEDGDAVAFTFGDLDARKLRREPTDEGKAITWTGRLRPLLWPLPPEAVGAEVHLCVSESDCGALLACGFEAYALTKGDGGTAELFRALKVLRSRGAERVVVWTDADKSGRQARSEIVAAVQSVGLPVVYPDTDALADPLTGEKDVNDVFRRLGPEALVDAAMSALVDVPQPPRTLTHAEMLAAGDEQIDWRVPDLIGPGDKVGIIGPYKSRKTFVLMDLARALATGAPFVGVESWRVPRPFRVLVVEEEGSRQRFGQRVAAMPEIPRDTDLLRWRHRTGFDFTSEARVDALVDEMREHGTDVVILDPFQRMSGDGEENSATAMKPAWDAVARMQAAIPDLVVVIVFHTRKDDSLSLDSIRGSGRHAGELDVALMVRKQDAEHSLLTIEGRDVPPVGQDGEAMRVRFDYEPAVRLHVSVDGTTTFKVVKVPTVDRLETLLSLVPQPGDVLTKDAAVAGLKLSDRMVRGYIKQLVEQGHLEEAFGPGGVKSWKRTDEPWQVGRGYEIPLPTNLGSDVGSAAILPTTAANERKRRGSGSSGRAEPVMAGQRAER